MRRSEFDELSAAVFGPVLAHTYRRDVVLAELGGRSANDAIDAGVPIRHVWNALCDAMDVPEDQRWEVPAHARSRRG